MHTIKNYKNGLLSYYSFLRLKKIDHKKADKFLIDEYKATLENAGYKQNTIRNRLLIVRTFYEYLIYKGQSIVNPCPKFIIPKEQLDRVHALSAADLEKVLDYLEQKELYVRVLFYLMLYAGLRVNEVANVKCEDIRVIENKLIVHIPGDIAKGNKKRIAPYIDAPTGKKLLEYIKNSSKEKISRISKRTIQYHATQISKALGIKFTCHVLRHNYATELLERNVRLDVIQEALGHENIETTRRYAETLLHNITNVAAKI